MKHYLCIVRLFLSLLLPILTFGQGIEGAGERYKFEAGDKTIYQAKLAQCPVGKFLPEWKIAKGSYECARFQDRIWIRPLEGGAVIYLPFKESLPDEWSLEFSVYAFEAGAPYMKFALHPAEHVARLREFGHAHNEKNYMAGVIVGSRSEYSRFGVRDEAVASHLLEDFKMILPPNNE